MRATSSAVNRSNAGTIEAAAPGLSLIDRGLVRAQAAARTAFYTAVGTTAWRLGLPFTDVEREYGRHAIREAYELHVEMLERPGMREVLRAVERQDLATLPVFATLIPFDVIRTLRKRQRGLARLPVRPDDAFPYPDYYLNDFHNQANGNLSLRAALTYDWHIRFLFMGADKLMRQPAIDEVPRGDDLDVLDVACGTGTMAAQSWLQGRRHRAVGIDLSPHYLRVAKMFRGGYSDFIQMNAEHLAPEWTARFDVVTCVWLFHELPPDAIERATAEIARVLKPGGKLVFVEAAQASDVPEARATIEAIGKHFEDFFNEPYFAYYQQLDLKALFARHGLEVDRSRRCYTSKTVVAFRRG